MKRIAAILLCAMLAWMTFAGFAEAPDALPSRDLSEAGDDPSAADESIVLQTGGAPLTLAFDSSPEYSSVGGGVVQASFYAYDADGVTLYEMYLIFPDTVQAGMVITPDYAALINAESSVVLIVSDNTDERYYLSSASDGGTFPEESEFAMSFDAVEPQADGSCVFSGSLQATLVQLDMASGEVYDTVIIQSSSFRFTLGASASASPLTPMPSATPDDMRRV